MRPRAVGLAVVGSAAVLIAGWQLGARPATESAPVPVSPDPSEAAASPGRTADASPSSSRSATTAAGPSGTFTGSVDHTRYGPVQVAALVRRGRLVDVKALQLTNDGGRSVAISADAAPQLRVEALDAQSAKIDTVSGATYTSDGYRTSLQAALDEAGL